MSSSVVIIYNPVAKGASEKGLSEAADYFRQAGADVKVMATRRAGEAEAFAREAVSSNPRMVIAAGGDGTINEVANGLVYTDRPMAIIPFGTTNVLAREIFESRKISDILEAINTRPAHSVSLGKITTNVGGIRKSRYFCLMAGIGFDGMAVRDVDLSLKKYTGPAAYVLSGLKVLAFYNPAEIILDVDGTELRGHAAIIGKVSRYGGDFMVTPDAKIEDPRLFVCLFKGNKRLDLVRYAVLAVTKRHLRDKDVAYLPAKRVSVRGSSAVQIDGDYFGESPVDIEVCPGALRLIF